MISSPGCVCIGATYPGPKSTRTWMTSRPGALKSYRCKSVRLLPACCAEAAVSANALPRASSTTHTIRIVFILNSCHQLGKFPQPKESASDLAGGKVLGNRRPGEFPRQQAGEAHDRSAWPITRYDMLGLPSVVALDQYDTADWLAANFGDVVLEPAVVPVRADKLKLLAVIQRLDGQHH